MSLPNLKNRRFIQLSIFCTDIGNFLLEGTYKKLNASLLRLAYSLQLVFYMEREKQSYVINVISHPSFPKKFCNSF